MTIPTSQGWNEYQAGVQPSDANGSYMRMYVRLKLNEIKHILTQ